MIEDARFQPSFWLDRPAWWTERVLENRQLAENRRPWEMKPLKYCFAEDTSLPPRPGSTNQLNASPSKLLERWAEVETRRARG